MQSMLAHVKERTRLDNLDTQVLMQPSQFGRRDGSNLHVALLGRPNAGTSTLFNALAGRRTSASPFLGETRRVNRGRSEHRTPEFEWLCQLYMPASARPVTYALSDCPSAPGAAGADVVMVVLRAFEGDEVTHQATTVDPARDLLYVANACRLHDVWKLKRRIQVEARATKLGINPRYCVVYSGAFEKRLQILRETPTPPPVEEHMRARPPLEAYLDANLILLFTCSPDEVRAWFVRDGTTVIGFCGGVHEVMRRNFEVAEICDYADYVACGSEEQVRRKGKVRRLGADVVLEHHQVIFVKFKIPRESEAADGRVAWNSDGRLSTREMDKKAQQDMAVQEEARKQLDEETDHHVRTGLRF
ncbi:GTP binding protein [Aureococcus anophagefferens]|nr:GTP binding protein [Aureococcus anophagefferens]